MKKYLRGVIITPLKRHKDGYRSRPHTVDIRSRANRKARGNCNGKEYISNVKPL